MTQREIEIILTRQLASYLALPIFITDPVGTLVFYNEPAEAILGRRFEETGEMPLAEWGQIYTAADPAGMALSVEELPLTIALRERRPAHRRMTIRGLDGVHREIEVTALPLIAQAGRHLGAVALFWEAPCT